ncbi:hypothetical protein ABK040_006989 [Willaertia magna]
MENFGCKSETANDDNNKQPLGEDHLRKEDSFIEIPFHKEHALNNFTIYETSTRFYIIGRTSLHNYRLLKINKIPSINCSLEDYIQEDVGEYNYKQMNELIKMIKLATKSIKSEFLLHSTNIYGILGIIGLKYHYYLILIKDRKKVANIGICNIFEIKDVQLISLNSNILNKSEKQLEDKYLEIFNQINLKQDFYFSYHYNLYQTLQNNILKKKEEINNDYIWNYYLNKHLPKYFQLPIIHGSVQYLNYNQLLNVLIIARRSTQYAGTRYLKRGINDYGYTANQVEIEQIVFQLLDNYHIGNFSSFVQLRGSVPIYWSQRITKENGNKLVDKKYLKPNIYFTKFDPFYLSSKQHFELLLKRYDYCNHIVCLDLLKQFKDSKEKNLSEQYKKCINFLNNNYFNNNLNNNLIEYIAFDLRNTIKDKPEKALNEIYAIAEYHLKDCQILLVLKNKLKSLQKNIIRTNCVDCLDRTGVTQFIIFKYVLNEQLKYLNVIDNLIYYNDLINYLMNMYEIINDHIALQYSGSKTVSVDIQNKSTDKIYLNNKLMDILTSVKRYYSNNFRDIERQYAMNLFLGNYIPHHHVFECWEFDDHSLDDFNIIDNDNYLSNSQLMMMEEENDDNGVLLEENELIVKKEMKALMYNIYKTTDFEDELLAANQISSSLTSGNNNNTVTSTSIQKNNSGSLNTLFSNNSNTVYVEEDEPIANSHSITNIIFKNSDNNILPQGEILRNLEGKMESTNMVNDITKDIVHIDCKKYIDLERNNNNIEIYSNYLDKFDNKFDIIYPNKDSNFIIPNVIVNYNDIEIYKNYTTKKEEEEQTIIEQLSVQSPILQSPIYSPINSPIYSPQGLLSPTTSISSNSNNILLSSNPYLDEILENNEGKEFYKFIPSYDIKHLQSNLQKLIQKLKSELTLSDRVRYPKHSKTMNDLLKGRIYRRCFESKDLVNILINKLKIVDNRRDAIEFGNLLLQYNIIQHVTFVNIFVDGFYLYRFINDNPVRILNMNYLFNNFSRIHPNTLLQQIMNSIRQIYQNIFVKYNKYNYKHTSFFKLLFTNSRKTICNVSNYKDTFILLLHQLQRIDLLFLTENEMEFKLFFLNLFFILFSHGLLLMGGNSKNRIIGRNATFVFYNNLQYIIDGLTFSLSDIKDYIFKGNLQNNNILGEEIKDKKRANLIYYYQPYLDLRILCVIKKYSELLWKEDSQISILPNSNNFKNRKLKNTCILFPYLSKDNLEEFLKEEFELYCLQHLKIISHKLYLSEEIFKFNFGKTKREIINKILFYLKETSTELDGFHLREVKSLKEQLLGVKDIVFEKEDLFCNK